MAKNMVTPLDLQGDDLRCTLGKGEWEEMVTEIVKFLIAKNGGSSFISFSLNEVLRFMYNGDFNQWKKNSYRIYMVELIELGYVLKIPGGNGGKYKFTAQGLLKLANALI